MAYSERIIGFSTGALAKGDFRHAISLLRETQVSVIELSALREDELPGLMTSLDEMDLSDFSYISVHTPTKLNQMGEGDVIRCLDPAIRRKLPIVVHPDVVQTPEIWRGLNRLLVIENMDKRKPKGRTVEELANTFAALPEARFCFDVAHAGQVDSTMTEAAQMLRHFGSRICQIHASGVSTSSGHGRLSVAAGFAISRISHLIPKAAPIILESPVDKESISSEIEFAKKAFDPWLDRLRADIDGVFGLQIPALRHSQITAFLQTLQMTRAISNLESVICQLPSGGSYRPGDAFFTAKDLMERLSDAEKEQLWKYFLERIRQLVAEFPDLKTEFRGELEKINSIHAS